MATILDVIDDYSPADGEVSVPLKTTIEILFDRALNQSVMSGEFFVEGPDTDQFVGPAFNLLEFPDNISQGDDFLESPGYKGIVQGVITFTDGAKRLVFTPDEPLAALTNYKAHLPEVTDATGAIHSGYVTFSFTTGTGSIQVLPSTVSSSILNTALQATVPGNTEPLRIVKITPDDHAIEQDPEIKQIVVEFNKYLDPVTITQANVKVEALPATDHPKAAVGAEGELAKSLEVDGKKLIIKI